MGGSLRHSGPRHSRASDAQRCRDLAPPGYGLQRVHRSGEDRTRWRRMGDRTVRASSIRSHGARGVRAALRPRRHGCLPRCVEPRQPCDRHLDLLGLFSSDGWMLVARTNVPFVSIVSAAGPMLGSIPVPAEYAGALDLAEAPDGSVYVAGGYATSDAPVARVSKTGAVVGTLAGPASRFSPGSDGLLISGSGSTGVWGRSLEWGRGRAGLRPVDEPRLSCCPRPERRRNRVRREHWDNKPPR